MFRWIFDFWRAIFGGNLDDQIQSAKKDAENRIKKNDSAIADHLANIIIDYRIGSGNKSE
jgi:hypothetical protein